MKKLFISQPMDNKSEEEIIIEREKAMEKVKNIIDDDIELIDSYIQFAPRNATPLWNLGKSIQLLSQADIAYFVPDWNDASGCRIEYMCARDYGIKIINNVEVN